METDFFHYFAEKHNQTSFLIEVFSDKESQEVTELLEKYNYPMYSATGKHLNYKNYFYRTDMPTMFFIIDITCDVATLVWSPEDIIKGYTVQWRGILQERKEFFDKNVIN